MKNLMVMAVIAILMVGCDDKEPRSHGVCQYPKAGERIYLDDDYVTCIGHNVLRRTIWIRLKNGREANMSIEEYINLKEQSND